MSGFTAIDLTKLPAPEVIEVLDFETIRSEMIADFQSRHPDYDALLESDPAIKLLEAAAYRELHLRARINNAARAVMLAFARKNDLEHIAAGFGVARQLIDAGDDSAVPPILPTYESDDRLRKRTQLSLEGHSTAGSEGSYIFFALAASPLVKDVDVFSPEEGRVLVSVLSIEQDGVADDALQTTVLERLNAKTVRPLTDHVRVQSADIMRYTVSAELMLYDGPDAEVVRHAAEGAVRRYVEQHHLLGNDIPLSGLYAALHQAGVQRVILQAPISDIVVQRHQAAWCTHVAVTIGGRDE